MAPMNTRLRLLALVVGLQVLWIIGTAAFQESRLARGTVVRLETVPVDPRDLLRGDYVILRYKISLLSPTLFANGATNAFKSGDAVYVKLEREGELHQPVLASFDPITPDDAHPVLRGTVPAPWSSEGRDRAEVHVEYGLERYYVREGTGNPTGKLTVDVAVSRSGKGIIQQVYVDGRPYAEAMR